MAAWRREESEECWGRLGSIGEGLVGGTGSSSFSASMPASSSISGQEVNVASGGSGDGSRASGSLRRRMGRLMEK